MIDSTLKGFSNCAQILSGASHNSLKDVPVNGTVYGTLLNFKASYSELEPLMTNQPYQRPPEAPILYIKPRNTYNRHKGTIWLPDGIHRIQIGPALGIVIGKTAAKVTEAHAMHYIAGYTILNDVSLEHDSLYRPPIRFNALDGFCPIGPEVKEASLVQDPHNLKIDVFVNDQLMQTSHTNELVRPIPTLLADVTEFMTLYPGDVLMAGTPNNPPLVCDGDRIRITIDKIGSLENQVQSLHGKEQEGNG